MESRAKVRKPAVAGTFYPSSLASLRSQIESCFARPLGPGILPQIGTAGPATAGEFLGLVCPHAGYIFSGPVAAHSYLAAASYGRPEVVVLLGPNHHTWKPPLASASLQSWQTPLGLSPIAHDLFRTIQEACPALETSDDAHTLEHSLEVQLPFLQYLYDKDVLIAPILMADQSLPTAQELGRAIARAVEGKRAIIIASSDFSHYETHTSAALKDEAAISAILQLDAEGLFRAVVLNKISMCGPGPVAAMLTACSILGASRAELLRYATSGDVTGDYSRVVAYASLKVTGKSK